MLFKLDVIFKKFLPMLTPVSVLIGVLLGSRLAGFSGWSPWIFGFMTFSGSISFNFRQFVRILVQPVPLLTTLFILHVIVPLFALGFGHVFYSQDRYTILGLVLATAIPTGVTSFIWVAIYKGNTPITLSIILVDTLLSPVVVPYTISLLMGAKVHIDIIAMMQGLFFMIVLPSLVGMLLNQWTNGKVDQAWGATLAPFAKISMAVVVAINSAVVAPFLRHFDLRLVGLLASVLVISIVGYVIGWLAARVLKWEQDILIALVYNSGMRNISAGAVLAVAYFPAPVAIPVVLCMLFQQSLAALCGYLIARRSQRSSLLI